MFCLLLQNPTLFDPLHPQTKEMYSLTLWPFDEIFNSSTKHSLQSWCWNVQQVKRTVGGDRRGKRKGVVLYPKWPLALR